MTVYGYRVADRQGKITEGVIEASEEHAALGRLREMGYLPIRVWPASGAPGGSAGAPGREGRGRGRAARREILPFFPGLRTLLVAGIPLDRSLEMLRDLNRGKAMGTVAGEMLKEIRAGNSLAEAMRKAPGAPFNRFMIQMVNAGQATGRLEEALDQVYRFQTRSRDFRANLAGSLIYPAILLCASLLSVVLLV